MATDQNRNFTVDDLVAAFPDALNKRDSPDPKQYTVHRVVGCGVSGTAFLVNRNSDNKNLIAKVTNLSSLSDKKQAYARSEVQCLRQCDHFAIIKHVGDLETEKGDKLVLLMELADAGDLGRQVKHRARALQSRTDPQNDNRPTYFREHEVAFLFLQVVLAVHYLHRKAILHRDIKSANVFLMSVGIVKLGDLGFSQVYEATVSAEVGRTFCGTPYYLAPELQSRTDPQNDNRPTYFREHEVAFLFLQVVLAVHYLHRKAILHRDIKSANVFLMSVGIVKLGDLGFSQVYEATVSAEVGRTFCGTPYYLAPELWRRHRYSKKADVWSLGVLLYEMAALKRPFAGDTMLKLFDRIMTGKYDPLPECFSPDLCDLVDSILVFDPEARPATGDILRNKYMQFVMTQFERTISSGANQFSDQEKQYILSAVADARNSVAGPPPPMPTGPQRNVVKKSIVLKQSANMWKQRYLIFDGSVLTVSAVEQTVGQTRNLELRDIETVNVSTPEVSRQNCFTIVLSSEHGGQVHFQERSAEEAAIWVNVLNRALEEHQKQKAVNDSAEMLRERVPDRALQPDSPTNMDGEAPGPFPTLGGPTLDSLSPSAGPNAAAADAAPAAEAAPTA
eukprot:CAMPEP_0174878438 /NCGR_PEP_ID=MMETSP1114-20130205/82754_1 /TAXON_ID=312471 /ORGANISM="Neobodo designis, Strain CCAP 1951/1" /LENGTH=618 /DNA_ID=CAMNT_0016113827 /DNA_START=336 /DNA_END=2192 /DNA_ORIENTATION=-